MKKTLSKPQIRLVGTAIVLALSVLLYRILILGKLEQTSALFVGIPTLLAIGLSLLPPSKSMTGSLLKGTMIALMLSGIVLSEGFVCIAMATPLFALIAVIIGFIIDRSRKKKAARLMSLLFLLPMAMEGVFPDFEMNRQNVVTVSLVSSIPMDKIKSRLAREVYLNKALPFFLQMGFPRADFIKGEGASLGDQKCAHFSGGEGDPGSLCLEVIESSERRVKFKILKDKSHIAHWLEWESATVEWRRMADGRTDISWSLAYERKLDPAWYFSPLESYGVKLAAGYLLASYFGL